MKRLTCLAAGWLLVVSQSVLADDAAPAVAPDVASSRQTQGADDSTLRPADTGFGVALDSNALAEYRGGAEISISDMNVKGSLHDSVATDLTTGSNLITQGAFTNTSGMPMTIQNSGNNVLIQNATIINVTSY